MSNKNDTPVSRPNPFTLLFRSRKFLLLLMDAIVSVILFFIGKYVPQAAEDVKFLIVTLQPVVIALIAAIAVEDSAFFFASRNFDE